MFPGNGVRTHLPVRFDAAGQRVVDRDQTAGVVAGVGEVALALRRSGDGGDLLARVLLVFVILLPGEEEEGLVFAVIELWARAPARRR